MLILLLLSHICACNQRAVALYEIPWAPVEHIWYKPVFPMKAQIIDIHTGKKELKVSYNIFYCMGFISK